jgi:putative tricarboxylic transport membrane protein
MEYVIWGLLGALYGTLIGVLPMAGATTGLLTVFALAPYFLTNPYLGIVFMTSLIASSSTGDSYTSILTGIPGGGQTAASILDGHPMALRGEAGRAIGISLMDSTLNGVFWGLIAFVFLPIYGKVVLYFGVPEFAALLLLSFCCVGLLTSKNFLVAFFSVIVGLWLGLIGLDPSTSSPRFTFGWDYLDSGIQILPMIAGLFAIPELLEGWKRRNYTVVKIENYYSQLFQGFKDCLTYWKDVVRGGFIGFFTGILPGAGGTIGDMLSYGITVAKNPKEEFGNGNPRGLAGCEGANNAQKASSMLPTILFGIPAAPFAAVMMAICVYFGIHMGSPELLSDQIFIWSIGASFILSTIFTFILGIFITKYVVKILELPYWIYGTSILCIVVWSCFQYTGTLNDLYILMICSIIGLGAKYLHLSKPAILLCFIVAEKFENYAQQAYTLYGIMDLVQRPITVGLFSLSLIIFYWTLTRRKNNA